MSAQQSIASSAASALPTLDVLILGMAFVSAEYESMSVARLDTTISALRDRARLLQLQLEQPQMKIITCNNNQSAKECEPQRHLKGGFDQRLAKELQESFSSIIFFHHIYLDYFRFPGAYMNEAYGPFVRSMLPKLIELGLMSFEQGTQLIMPNLPTLLQQLQQKQYVRLIPSTATSLDASMKTTTQQCFLHFTSLTAADYPLYAATDRVETQPDTLGGFKNNEQITQLHSVSPFVSIRITESKSESDKSYLEATRAC